MESNPINKVSKIKQILPDYITCDILLKKCLCIKVPRKDTSKTLSLLKNNNFFLEKINLKDINYHTLNFFEDYQRPEKDKSKNEYQEYDCSFLKRVKKLNETENLIIISFIDDLSYRKINEELILKKFGFSKDNLIQVDVPCTEPISEEQYQKSIKTWPICNYINTKEKYIYKHNSNEEKEILDIFNDYLLNKDIDSLLYDPKKRSILVTSKKNKNNIVTGHSIMVLLDNYSQSLIDKKNENKHEGKNEEKEEKLELKIGVKNEEGPKENTDLLFGDRDIGETGNKQYYAEGMYIFTKEEPCMMCAMALIHNRIDRLYFKDNNPKEGALISKYSLDNYNLNHHYLVFEFS